MASTMHRSSSSSVYWTTSSNARPPRRQRRARSRLRASHSARSHLPSTPASAATTGRRCRSQHRSAARRGRPGGPHRHRYTRWPLGLGTSPVARLRSLNHGCLSLVIEPRSGLTDDLAGEGAGPAVRGLVRRPIAAQLPSHTPTGRASASKRSARASSISHACAWFGSMTEARVPFAEELGVRNWPRRGTRTRGWRP